LLHTGLRGASLAHALAQCDVQAVLFEDSAADRFAPLAAAAAEKKKTDAPSPGATFSGRVSPAGGGAGRNGAGGGGAGATRAATTRAATARAATGGTGGGGAGSGGVGGGGADGGGAGGSGAGGDGVGSAAANAVNRTTEGGPRFYQLFTLDAYTGGGGTYTGGGRADTGGGADAYTEGGAAPPPPAWALPMVLPEPAGLTQLTNPGARVDPELELTNPGLRVNPRVAPGGGELNNHAARATDPLVFIYTSGTTGLPKVSFSG